MRGIGYKECSAVPFFFFKKKKKKKNMGLWTSAWPEAQKHTHTHIYIETSNLEARYFLKTIGVSKQG
jgi:hypothetical protein